MRSYGKPDLRLGSVLARWVAGGARTVARPTAGASRAVASEWCGLRVSIMRQLEAGRAKRRHTATDFATTLAGVEHNPDRLAMIGADS